MTAPDLSEIINQTCRYAMEVYADVLRPRKEELTMLPTRITYEWIVSLSWNGDQTGHSKNQTRLGEYSAPATMDRRDLRQAIISQAAKEMGVDLLQPVVVLFMDFTPMDQVVHLTGTTG